MDTDFTGLAAKIAADIQDLRGVVVVSRDGLVLGSYPADGEAILRPAWLRFASLGDVEKGFVQFGSELWVYVRRGPYASFAVSNAVSRPGLLMDELENVLLIAEEARGAGQPTQGTPGMASSRPRTTLHPDSRPAAPGPPVPAPQVPSVADAGYAELASMTQQSPAIGSEAPTVMPDAPDEVAPPTQGISQPATLEPPAPQPVAPPSAPAPAPPPPAVSQWDDGDVDRVALAQEFAQLLGESGYDDEDSEP